MQIESKELSPKKVAEESSKNNNEEAKDGKGKEDSENLTLQLESFVSNNTSQDEAKSFSDAGKSETYSSPDIKSRNQTPNKSRVTNVQDIRVSDTTNSNEFNLHSEAETLK